MTKEEAIEWLKSLNYCDGEETQEVAQAIDMAIKALEQQPNDFVPVEVYKQVTAERDIAIEQLKELGYEFGEKIRTSEDCVSRADLLKLYEDRFIELQKAHQTDKQLGVNWCINTLKEMPPVTPTHCTCKDCKYNRPNSYARTMFSCERGNRFKLRDCENFYCADFERRK